MGQNKSITGLGDRSAPRVGDAKHYPLVFAGFGAGVGTSAGSAAAAAASGADAADAMLSTHCSSHSSSSHRPLALLGLLQQ